jgi:hypothetical protein
LLQVLEQQQKLLEASIAFVEKEVPKIIQEQREQIDAFIANEKKNLMKVAAGQVMLRYAFQGRSSQIGRAVLIETLFVGEILQIVEKETSKLLRQKEMLIEESFKKNLKVVEDSKQANVPTDASLPYQNPLSS